MRSASRLAFSSWTWGAVSLGGEAVEIGLVPAGIDDEEDVALLDQLAGLKADFADEAGDARADLDGFDRFGAAGEVVPFDEVFLLDAGDGDGGLGRGRRGARFGGSRSRAGERRRQSGARNRRRR